MLGNAVWEGLRAGAVDLGLGMGWRRIATAWSHKAAPRLATLTVARAAAAQSKEMGKLTHWRL
jgi:hypothetical protein